MPPLIVNAAITGMVPTKKDNPYVPISPSEVIADVRRCRDAGATIVHLHAREEDQTPTYRREVYDWTAKQPATNARLIERIVLLARAAGREVATAEEARQIIGMRSSVTPLRMAA